MAVEDENSPDHVSPNPEVIADLVAELRKFDSGELLSALKRAEKAQREGIATNAGEAGLIAVWQVIDERDVGIRAANEAEAASEVAAGRSPRRSKMPIREWHEGNQFIGRIMHVFALGDAVDKLKIEVRELSDEELAKAIAQAERPDAPYRENWVLALWGVRKERALEKFKAESRTLNDEELAAAIKAAEWIMFSQPEGRMEALWAVGEERRKERDEKYRAEFRALNDIEFQAALRAAESDMFSQPDGRMAALWAVERERRGERNAPSSAPEKPADSPQPFANPAAEVTPDDRRVVWRAALLRVLIRKREAAAGEAAGWRARLAARLRRDRDGTDRTC